MSRTLRMVTLSALILLAAGAMLGLFQMKAKGLWLSHKPDMPMKERLSQQGLRPGNPIFIRAFKAEAELELWMLPDGGDGGESYKLFYTYPICAMSGTLGTKQRYGDKQVPEGFYSVGLKQLNPHSQFHLAFNIGYPNAYDRAHGYTGDGIMVHGDCRSAGCLAMTDALIDEIYALAESALRGGQPYFRVQIFPFRMTGENMRRYASPAWDEFWNTLRPGYDYFEKYRQPPDMGVANKRYVLSGKNKTL